MHVWVTERREDTGKWIAYPRWNCAHTTRKAARHCARMYSTGTMRVGIYSNSQMRIRKYVPADEGIADYM